MAEAKRLDKFLSECFELSRSIIGKEVRAKHVSVNGEVQRDPAFKVYVGDHVALGDVDVEVYDKLYFMVNKPAGCVCANDDPNYPIVFSFIEEFGIHGCHCVGRLDLDTTGLILITNDGQWSHRIASPKHHCGKVYEVTLAEPVTQQQIAQLEKGILLNGEKKETAPAVVTVRDPLHIELNIFEGKYHQVKRMIAAVGNEVTALNRISIGALKLDPVLEQGEYRPLTEEEIALFS